MPIHIVLKHFGENDREKLMSLPVLISILISKNIYVAPFYHFIEGSFPDQQLVFEPISLK